MCVRNPAPKGRLTPRVASERQPHGAVPRRLRFTAVPAFPLRPRSGEPVLYSGKSSPPPVSLFVSFFFSCTPPVAFFRLVKESYIKFFSLRRTQSASLPPLLSVSCLFLLPLLLSVVSLWYKCGCFVVLRCGKAASVGCCQSFVCYSASVDNGSCDGQGYRDNMFLFSMHVVYVAGLQSTAPDRRETQLCARKYVSHVGHLIPLPFHGPKHSLWTELRQNPDWNLPTG